MKLVERFKHRKPKVYLFFGFYVALVLLIVIESCMGSSLSGSQSSFFAMLSSWIINLIKGPQIVEVLDPIAIGTVTDSSVLGVDEEGYAHIALGTTTLLSIEVKYPNKVHKDDTFNKSYTITNVLGNKDDYAIVSNTQVLDTTIKLNVRVVANKKTSDEYKLSVNLANNVKHEYKFKVVDLARPTNFEAVLNKTNIKIGESTTISTKLMGNDARGDRYYKRYYDISLIERSSSNPSVATVDEYGVVHGINPGTAKIRYGDNEFNVTVSNEHAVVPATNSITLTKTGNNHPNLLDYDYVYEQNETPDLYSVVLKPTFQDTSLEDKSVSWTIDTNIKAKLGPYRYDANGFPVYKDAAGNPACRISGYREKGNVKVTCISNADNNVTQTYDLEVEEAVATNFTLNYKTLAMSMGEQKIISVALDGFTPKNVNNKDIHITCSDEEAFTFTNNYTADVTILANKIGDFTLVIKSLSNPTLTKELKVSVTAKQAINEDNFSDFHDFMRKFSGHMLLFLVTTVFGFLYFYYFFDDKKHRFLFALCLALGVSLFVAGLSEFIQLLVPGRSGTFMDVGIDFLGAVIGMIIVSGIYWLIYWIKSLKKKNRSETE